MLVTINHIWFGTVNAENTQISLFFMIIDDNDIFLIFGFVVSEYLPNVSGANFWFRAGAKVVNYGASVNLGDLLE